MRYGHGVPCQRVEVVEAAHPVPDRAGVAAAERILELVRRLGREDMVLCLISGGGSSLLVSPAEGLTLADKQTVNSALLRSGATISEMNCLRRHLSSIKGGRLAAACHPARVINLLISDVPGDRLIDIASGPTVADPTTCGDALEIVSRYGIALPQAARRLLESGAGESVKPDDPRLQTVETTLVAAPQLALEAAAEVARNAGYAAHILGDSIEAEAREVGTVLAGIARQVPIRRQPLSHPVSCSRAAKRRLRFVVRDAAAAMLSFSSPLRWRCTACRKWTCCQLTPMGWTAPMKPLERFRAGNLPSPRSRPDAARRSGRERCPQLLRGDRQVSVALHSPMSTISGLYSLRIDAATYEGLVDLNGNFFDGVVVSKIFSSEFILTDLDQYIHFTPYSTEVYPLQSHLNAVPNPVPNQSPNQSTTTSAVRPRLTRFGAPASTTLSRARRAGTRLPDEAGVILSMGATDQIISMAVVAPMIFWVAPVKFP